MTVMDRAELPVSIDTSVAHSARAYDYYLGGKDNFEKDRELGRRTEQAWPAVRVFARENRLFMQRAVRYLAAEEGIGQFLDIGSGIPTSPNVHEIAQRWLPASRVVYVDHDPLVIGHARALLRSSPEGRAEYLYADAREPDSIIAGAAQTLDFTKPVAVLLVAVLHFLPDPWDPGAILGAFLKALPPGSFLIASQITDEHDPATIHAAAEVYRRGTGAIAAYRAAAEFEELAITSQGLQAVDPGVVLVSEWRDEPRHRPTPAQVSCYGVVARKP